MGCSMNAKAVEIKRVDPHKPLLFTQGMPGTKRVNLADYMSACKTANTIPVIDGFEFIDDDLAGLSISDCIFRNCTIPAVGGFFDGVVFTKCKILFSDIKSAGAYTRCLYEDCTYDSNNRYPQFGVIFSNGNFERLRKNPLHTTIKDGIGYISHTIIEDMDLEHWIKDHPGPFVFNNCEFKNTDIAGDLTKYRFINCDFDDGCHADVEFLNINARTFDEFTYNKNKIVRDLEHTFLKNRNTNNEPKPLTQFSGNVFPTSVMWNLLSMVKGNEAKSKYFVTTVLNFLAHCRSKGITPTFMDVEFPEGVDLSTIIFSGSHFINCTLSNPILNNTSFVGARFTGCNLNNLFAKTELVESVNLYNTTFENLCVMDKDTMEKLEKYKTCTLNKCKLKTPEFHYSIVTQNGKHCIDVVLTHDRTQAFTTEQLASAIAYIDQKYDRAGIKVTLEEQTAAVRTIIASYIVQCKDNDRVPVLLGINLALYSDAIKDLKFAGVTLQDCKIDWNKVDPKFFKNANLVGSTPKPNVVGSILYFTDNIFPAEKMYEILSHDGCIEFLNKIFADSIRNFIVYCRSHGMKPIFRDMQFLGGYNGTRTFKPKDLSGINFNGCWFTNCHFSSPQLTDTQFSNACFSNCKFDDFLAADGAMTATLFNATMAGCDIGEHSKKLLDSHKDGATIKYVNTAEKEIENILGKKVEQTAQEKMRAKWAPQLETQEPRKLKVTWNEEWAPEINGKPDLFNEASKQVMEEMDREITSTILAQAGVANKIPIVSGLGTGIITANTGIAAAGPVGPTGPIGATGVVGPSSPFGEYPLNEKQYLSLTAEEARTLKFTSKVNWVLIHADNHRKNKRDSEHNFEVILFELSGATFKLTNLSSTTFKDCNLTGADFKDCDLAWGSFDNCDLTNANFENANITGRKFDTAYVYVDGKKYVGKDIIPFLPSLDKAVIISGSKYISYKEYRTRKNKNMDTTVFKQMIGNPKDEITEASWQLSAETIVDTIREPLINSLCDEMGIKGKMVRNQIGQFLKSDIGVGVIAGAISLTMPLVYMMLPKDVQGYALKMGTQLRTLGYKQLMTPAVKILTGPLKRVLTDTLRNAMSLQKIRIDVTESNSSEESTDYMETDTNTNKAKTATA